ncbi:MAG: virulence protein RhuM/Fic/DOC family protein [Lachnospiraceae bacterium]|nr:virulence protein RhuM/Fic/DOC family protein [Lachnospiraceae bacterium]
MAKENEIVLFETEDEKVKLSVPIQDETVWLTQDQMSELFDTARSSIAYHIGNIFREKELERDTSVEIFDRSKNSSRPPQYYNLDVIISVGYRVKSQRGIEFRRWANKVLKDYIIKGYAINDKRLEALQKTVEIQSRMISSILEIDGGDVLKAVNQYTKALTILDQYDHQSLAKPDGESPVYRITYLDCRKMVDSMEDTFKSDVFGVEKEAGKVEGIIAAVYQSVFGGDVYPSLEEKAANLLYFMIKDHPFADGCKRIAASLFLEFLNRNNALFKDGDKVISDSALVAITLMIAESDPKEKDIMTTLVMNLIRI